MADTTISSKLVKKLLRNTRPRGDEDDPPVPAQRTDAGVDATAVPFWKKRRIGVHLLVVCPPPHIHPVGLLACLLMPHRTSVV